MSTRIQKRRGTAAAWTSANPVLAAGEEGWETDTHKGKTGDGSTAWTSLLYDVVPDVLGTFASRASVGSHWDRNDYAGPAITLNGTSWVDLSGPADIVLSAEIGDVVTVGLSGVWFAEAVAGCIDCVSVVAAAPVNSWGLDAAPSATSYGIMAWSGLSNVVLAIGGSISRKLVSGDISAGTVTLRLRARTTTVGDKTLIASGDQPLTFWALNNG